MMQIAFIAVGGALGAIMRYWISGGLYSILGREFPYGTLAVNIMGSLLMGFLFVYVEKMNLSPEWRVGLMIGLLGAFTTFSAFSIETLNLIESGEEIKAALNILLSVTLCILGCWLGMLAGRNIQLT